MIITSFNKYDNQVKIYLEINRLNVVSDLKKLVRKKRLRNSIYFRNILQKMLPFVKQFNYKNVFFPHSNVDTI